MVTRYWPTDTLFWQVSIDHKKDVQDEHCKQRPSVSVNLLAGVCMVVIVAMLLAPTSNTAIAMITKRKAIVIPLNSNTSPDWRRTCHVLLVKTQ